jgi:4-amino-4-deoxy-L-arabinose transferase
LTVEKIYLIVAVVVFIAAWFYHVRERSQLAISLLVFGGILLRLYMASDGYLHAWDERFHALVAKNMVGDMLYPTLYKDPVLGENIYDWTRAHIWMHKQPFPLWSMSVFGKLFGFSPFAIRLPSLILSTLGIWLTYDLGKQLFNRKVGFFAAFLFAIQGLILEIGSGRVTTDHVDLFFLVLILLAVWFAMKYSLSNKLIFNVFCGVTVGLAILSKWLPALIVVPIWALLQVHKNGWDVKKMFFRSLPLLLAIGVTFVPWQVYTWNQFPQEQAWESSFNVRHIFETLEGMSGPFYYHFDKMRMVYGELVYIPLLWFVYYSFKNRTALNWSLLVWLLIPFVFFSIVQTKMQGYTLFTAPALLIICALFFHQLGQWYKTKKYRWWTVFLMVGLIVLPIRYSIERIKPFDSLDRSPSWVSELIEFNKSIDPTKKNIVFDVDHRIEVMFHTNAVAAYEFTPESHVLDSLENAGYVIYVNLSKGTRYSGPYNTIYLEEPSYEGK